MDELTLQRLGLQLPPCPQPIGAYRPVVIAGRSAYLSGQLAKTAQGNLITGRVGEDLTLAQGREAARAAALNVVSVIHHLIGFEKLEQFLRVVGYVQTAPGFYDVPKVIDAASDLFKEIFSDRGIHARTSVGMFNLPLNSAVELEVTLQLR